jgi:PAS domain S-box-containing protein
VSELVGFEPDELMQKDIWDLVHPDDRSQIREFARKRFAGMQAPSTYSARLITRDGEIRWVEFAVEGIMLKGEMAALGMVRDITESKQAQETLKESEETFRSLVQESVDGIMLIDEEGTVLEWNKALETITGIPPHEALGMSYIDLVMRTTIPEHRSSERIAGMKNETETALQTGTSPIFSRKMDAEICRPDGTRRKIQQTVFPIKTAKGFRIGSITRDITDG